jgi:glycosyltransferase involved in cell wall biosynthesis
MKVLLAHNYYRSSAPSGEDAVFRNERTLLERNGIDIISFERFNDDIDDSTVAKRIRLALNYAWSAETYREISALIRRTRPDLAHFHNIFPLISPSAYAACRDAGVPVVQTLHNFRFVCPGAMLLRNGRPCEDCLSRGLLPALLHRCYRDSFAATLSQVWTIASNRRRGTYRNLVDHYIALTGFAAERLVAGGLPAKRMSVKPNFLPDPPSAGTGEGGYAVYVGRLAGEKGIRTLLSAWRAFPGFPLKMAGDGPLRGELAEIIGREGLNVELLGMRNRAELIDMVGRAEMQIVPSECYEGFPLVILEALACGTPVVASRIGSLDEIVEDGITGVKFAPGEPAALADKVGGLLACRQRLGLMRRRSRALFENNYTAEINFTTIMEIYRRVLDGRAGNQEQRYRS